MRAPDRDPRVACDLMRRQLVALAPEDRLGNADALILLSRVRQLPVVRDAALVGELSYRDSARAYRQLLRDGGSEAEALGEALAALAGTPVANLMRPPAHCVSPQASLLEVVRNLVRRGSGFVPVVAQDGDGPPRLLGIVTETDLLHAAFRKAPR